MNASVGRHQRECDPPSGSKSVKKLALVCLVALGGAMVVGDDAAAFRTGPRLSFVRENFDDHSCFDSTEWGLQLSWFWDKSPDKNCWFKPCGQQANNAARFTPRTWFGGGPAATLPVAAPAAVPFMTQQVQQYAPAPTMAPPALYQQAAPVAQQAAPKIYLMVVKDKDKQQIAQPVPMMMPAMPATTETVGLNQTVRGLW